MPFGRANGGDTAAPAGSKDDNSPTPHAPMWPIEQCKANGICHVCVKTCERLVKTPFPRLLVKILMLGYNSSLGAE